MEGKFNYQNIEEDEEVGEGNFATLEIDFDNKTFKYHEEYKTDDMKNFVGTKSKKGEGKLTLDQKKLMVTLEKITVKCVRREENGKETEYTKEIGPLAYLYDENTDNLKAPIPTFGAVRWWVLDED